MVTLEEDAEACCQPEAAEVEFDLLSARIVEKNRELYERLAGVGTSAR